MAKPNRGLGRGLGALISTTTQEKPIVESVVSSSEIEIDKIETNPYQPRVTFNQEAIEELSNSIKLLGLIQPITVRPLENGRYQIISGERRFRATQLAGLKTIPAYILKTDDQGMIEMAIVENIQREDLDSIEVAMSFKRLIEECNLTQEAMAERVGKKRATVTNYLRLLKLPAEIQLAIKEKKLSMGHAKVLLGVEDVDKQLKLANQVIDKDLSVRQIEQKVQKLNSSPAKREKEESELLDAHYKVIELIGKYFNDSVTAKRDGKGRGEFVIRFSSDSQVEQFLDILEKKGE